MTDPLGTRSALGDRQTSLLEAFVLVLERRRVVGAAIVLGLASSLVLAAVAPRKFTSSTSFTPQGPPGTSARLGGLAGMAGQLGLMLPAEPGAESPEFYAAVLRSREVLGAMASETFELEPEGDEGGSSRTGTLAELLELGGRNDGPDLRREAAVEWLAREGVRVATSVQTGLVSVSVTTPWPDLSESLAQRLLELINSFNLERRQTRAAAERVFVEVRLAEVQDSLRAAEDRLERFLETNRQWAGSPELTFQRERLQRQVAMRQQVYTGLVEAHEQARIAEVRNTPVITVVQRPERPVRPDRRHRALTVVLGVLTGALVGVLAALFQEYAVRARQKEPEQFRRLSTAWNEVRLRAGRRPAEP